MRRTALPTLAAVGLIAVVATGCSGQQNSAVTEGKAAWQTGEAAGGHGAAAGHGAATPAAPAALYTGDIADPAGKKVGSVSISKAEHGMTVSVTSTGLTPGFHATHLHAIGKCEPKSPDPKDAKKTGDFLSSGGHLAGSGKDHPDHAGDLPMIYVGKDGTGSLITVTDRLTEELLGQKEGVAMVVHSGADNYGNIPTRYAAGGADAETKKAGDAGGRVGCAVLKKGGAGGSASSGH